jgi:hypothetical protein
MKQPAGSIAAHWYNERYFGSRQLLPASWCVARACDLRPGEEQQAQFDAGLAAVPSKALLTLAVIGLSFDIRSSTSAADRYVGAVTHGCPQLVTTCPAQLLCTSCGHLSATASPQWCAEIQTHHVGAACCASGHNDGKCSIVQARP